MMGENKSHGQYEKPPFPTDFYFGKFTIFRNVLNTEAVNQF